MSTFSESSMSSSDSEHGRCQRNQYLELDTGNDVWKSFLVFERSSMHVAPIGIFCRP